MSRTELNKQPSFKISFIGDANVGKTSILGRFVRASFGDEVLSTVGVSNVDTVVNVDGRSIPLNIWDTAGQERFRSLVPIYLKGAHLIVLVFDISEQTSFQNLQDWINLVDNMTDTKSPIFLVANKMDLEPAISISNVKKWAKDSGYDVFFVSAKSNLNIKELFVEIATRVETMQIKEITKIRKDDSSKSGCC